MKLRPISTVGALIVEGGRILLVKSRKWSGLFTLPGGKVEWGESLREAVVREVKEELSLDVEPLALVNVGEYLLEGNYHKRVHFIFHNILCRLKGGNVRPNEEVEEWRWFPLEEASSSEEVDEHTRRAVEHYLKGLCSLPLSSPPGSGERQTPPR